MNRITQLFVVVLGTIIVGFTANAQLTVTGGNLIVPDDRVGIGTATPETLLHVEGVNNTLILARGNTQGNSVLIQVRNLSSGDAGIMVRNGSGFWSAGIDGNAWTIRHTSDLQDGPKSELRIKPSTASNDSMMVYARSYNSNQAGFVARGTGQSFAFGNDNGSFAIKDTSDIKDGPGSELRMKRGTGGTDGIAVTARSHNSTMAAYIVRASGGFWASGVDGTNYQIKDTSDLKDGAKNQVTIKPSTGAGDSIGFTLRSHNSDQSAFITRGTGGVFAAGVKGNQYSIRNVSDIKDSPNAELIIKPGNGGVDGIMVTARSYNTNRAGFVARGTGGYWVAGIDNKNYRIKDTSDLQDGASNELSIKPSVSGGDSVAVTARAYGGSAAGLVVRSTAGNWVTGIKSDGNFHIGNGNDIKDGGIEKVTVTTGGKVGIGTTNPSHTLDIQANGPGGAATTARVYSGPAGNKAILTLHSETSSSFIAFRGEDRANSDRFSIGQRIGSGDLQIVGAGDVGDEPSLMTVKQNGRVGIGTDNPGMSLDVVGEVRASLDGYFGHFQLRNSGNRAMIQNNSGTNLVEINDNFRVDGTLRIGGGASAASSALQIDNGSIRLSEP